MSPRKRRRNDDESPIRRFGGGFVILLLAPLAVAISAPLIVSQLSRSSPPKTTEVVFLRPFDFDGHLSRELRVAEQVPGRCLEAGFSEGTGNPDAHRCFADDGSIYDPCWVELGRLVAACPGRPWSKQVVLMRLRRSPGPTRLDKNPRLNELHGPWGLELAQGDRCIFLQGAGAPTVAGQRENYRCEHGMAIGVPDRSHRVWTIDFVEDTAPASSKVTLARAWY